MNVSAQTFNAETRMRNSICMIDFLLYRADKMRTPNQNPIKSFALWMSNTARWKPQSEVNHSCQRMAIQFCAISVSSDNEKWQLLVSYSLFRCQGFHSGLKQSIYRKLITVKSFWKAAHSYTLVGFTCLCGNRSFYFTMDLEDKNKFPGDLGYFNSLYPFDLRTFKIMHLTYMI